MLYSCSVHFYVQQEVVFSSYETEALHGVLFKILSQVDANLSKEIHDSVNKCFTLSTFMPFTKRKGTVKVLEKERDYKFRITFLNDVLFHGFVSYFVTHNNPVFLNGVQLYPTKILTNDPSDPWCGETTFEQLLEGRIQDHLLLKFLTPTSFRRRNRQLILPEPESVFGSLLYRWRQAGGPTLLLGEDGIQKIEINKYELKTRREQFKDYSIKGFTGECEFWLGELSTQEKRDVMALAQFAFYSGVGYKATMGLGQVKVGQ